MPIISLNKNNSATTATTTAVAATAPTAAEVEKATCCEVACKHAKSIKAEDLMNNSSNSIKQKKSCSLVSRHEDDNWVDISDRRLRNSRLGALYDGSQFKGVQKCQSSKYDVLVDIKHVDLKESKISGYLNIEGLTSECPQLTTFFEGEIIGPKYSFLTRKWKAQQYIDACHWGKFPSFEQYMHTFNDDDFTYDPLTSDFVYMRWKEHFLVPDHRVSNIDGASFAGFYYICYQRSTNEIKGFYFYHENQEMFQKLILEHVEERSFSNFEFR